MVSKNHDRKTFWQEHISRYKASGMSRPEYCGEHGLKVSQLAYHFSRRDRAKQKAFAEVITTNAKMPVRPTSASRLMCGGGVVLELEAGSDPFWLAQLIRQIGGQS